MSKRGPPKLKESVCDDMISGMPVRSLESGEGRELALLKWGLIPFWAKDAKIASNLINARADTVATKPAFRAALKRKRCLIPADGFYEWKPIPGQKVKQPYLISVKGVPAFAFAGLWENWTSPEGHRRPFQLRSSEREPESRLTESLRECDTKDWRREAETCLSGTPSPPRTPTTA